MSNDFLIADLKTADDLFKALEVHQREDERDSKRRIAAAAVCLVVALAATGALAKTAFVLCFLAAVAFIRKEFNCAGRRWFIHHVVFSEVIRPRRDLVPPLVEALTRIQALSMAAQEARCSEGGNEGWSASPEAPDARHSAVYGAPEDHP